MKYDVDAMVAKAEEIRQATRYVSGLENCGRFCAARDILAAGLVSPPQAGCTVEELRDYYGTEEWTPGDLLQVRGYEWIRAKGNLWVNTFTGGTIGALYLGKDRVLRYQKGNIG